QYVGYGAEVIGRPQMAGAPHPGLHFVEDEQDAVLVADAAQPQEELWPGDDVAALALDGLDEDRGDLLGRDAVLEQRLDGRHVLWMRVRIVEGQVVPAGHGRAEAPPVVHLAGREADARVRAAVEAALECDDALTPRGAARELDRALHGLRAGV